MPTAAIPTEQRGPIADGGRIVPPDHPDAPGDEAHERLRALIERCRGDLYRTALRLTRHREEAEDLVQDALARAWRARATFRPEQNGRAWLFAIMINARAEAFRRARTAPATATVADIEDLPGSIPAADVPGHAQDPEDVVLSGLLSEEVQAVLHEIPEPFLTAFVLADVERFSYQEIQRILRVPLGTVRSRIARARRLLQGALWTYCLRTGVCRGPAPAAATASWLPDCIAACGRIIGFLGRELDAAVLAQVRRMVAPCQQCCDGEILQERLRATLRTQALRAPMSEAWELRLAQVVAGFEDTTPAAH